MIEPTTEPLTTPKRKLTREEEMAWPHLPKQHDPEEVDTGDPPPTFVTIGPDGQCVPLKRDPEKYKEMIDEEAFAFHCRGLSYRKVALAMRLPHSTVYKMVQRHLNRQRTVYAEQEADVRDELTEVLKVAAGKAMDLASRDNIQALKALLGYVNMRLKLLKIPNPTHGEQALSNMNWADQLAKWNQPGNSSETNGAQKWAQEASAAEENAETNEESTVNSPGNAAEKNRAQSRVQPSAHTAQPVKNKPVARRKQKKAKRVRKPVSGSALAAGQATSSPAGNDEQGHARNQPQGAPRRAGMSEQTPDSQKSHDVSYDEDGEDTNFGSKELT